MRGLPLGFYKEWEREGSRGKEGEGGEGEGGEGNT